MGGRPGRAEVGPVCARGDPVPGAHGAVPVQSGEGLERGPGAGGDPLSAPAGGTAQVAPPRPGAARARAGRTPGECPGGPRPAALAPAFAGGHPRQAGPVGAGGGGRGLRPALGLALPPPRAASGRGGERGHGGDGGSRRGSRAGSGARAARGDPGALSAGQGGLARQARLGGTAVGDGGAGQGGCGGGAEPGAARRGGGGSGAGGAAGGQAVGGGASH